MIVTRDEAMRSAVCLAVTGQFSNWWCIAARLRIKRYRRSDLEWTESQRQWLDRLCIESRRQRSDWYGRGIPARLIEFPTIRVERATGQPRA